MKTRTLGQSGLTVSALGLGCMGMSMNYGAPRALSWLLARRPYIVPIPGTTKPHRLEENIGAAEIVLTAAELADIQTALDGLEVAGHRYTAASEAMVGVEAPAKEVH